MNRRAASPTPLKQSAAATSDRGPGALPQASATACECACVRVRARRARDACVRLSVRACVRRACVCVRACGTGSIHVRRRGRATHGARP